MAVDRGAGRRSENIGFVMCWKQAADNRTLWRVFCRAGCLHPAGEKHKTFAANEPCCTAHGKLPQTCKSSVGDGVCCPVDGPENHDSFIGDMSGFALQTRQVLRQIQQWHIRQYFGTLKTVPYKITKITPPRETSAPTAGWLCIIYFTSEQSGIASAFPSQRLPADQPVP